MTQQIFHLTVALAAFYATTCSGSPIPDMFPSQMNGFPTNQMVDFQQTKWVDFQQSNGCNSRSSGYNKRAA
ncbi:hypothetical protein BDF19DRAFT_431510 [Syncephalis fuscata]|nr:hypothetical protein BDF19DRAFT_431510 [Syncephalis fuscata]